MDKFEDLKGKTILKIEGLYNGSDKVLFWTTDGNRYEMYHQQNCCENVYLEDLDGDIEDMIGTPILMADESSNSGVKPNEYSESWTWTFYKLATSKGYMTIRWLGESNGYYSERVDVYVYPDPEVVRVLKIEKGLE